MTTPRELINGALRLINVVQANESPTAEDTAVSAESLNAMIDSWSNEKLAIFTSNPYFYTLTPGKKDYTLGPGGDWDIERPMEVSMAYVRIGEMATGPVASFSHGPSGIAPATVQFADTTTGNPTSWLWNFGDGTPTSSVQYPSHTYTQAGSYTTTLTASNIYGSSTYVDPTPIIVGSPAVNPSYAWTGTNGSGAGNVQIIGPTNERITWTSFGGTATAAYFRTATPISGKTYCEFKVTGPPPGSFYTSFGVQVNPPNQFYIGNATGSAMMFSTQTSGLAGCGLSSAGLYNLNASVAGGAHFSTHIIGIAFDPATRRIWFSRNGLWVSGDPATNTAPSAVLNGTGSPFYFVTACYTCNVSSGNVALFIMPNQGTMTYSPPAGFARYQP